KRRSRTRSTAHKRFVKVDSRKVGSRKAGTLRNKFRGGDMRLLMLVVILTVAAPAQSPSVSVGSATARPGEIAYGALQVPAGSDAATTIQVAVIRGERPGKTAAFLAGSHGTEYTSIVALTRLIAKIDPHALTGTVIVLPLLNVASFEQM